MCWCKRSQMLNMAVSARRIQGSKFVWQSKVGEASDCERITLIMNTLKKQFKKIIKSNKKTVNLQRKTGPHIYHLRYQKVCARWVPWKFTDQMEGFCGGKRQVINLGSITMILRTSDTLQNNATKDHQCQRNSKPIPLLEKPFWQYSGTMKMLCSLTYC